MSDKCLNVKMSQCFWCGEGKEILIDKKLKDCDDNNSKYVFVNYDPCEKCQKSFDKGFLIMEASESPNIENQPEIQNGVYPTGLYWVVTNEAANKIFKPEVVKREAAFIDKEAAIKIGLYQDQ